MVDQIIPSGNITLPTVKPQGIVPSGNISVPGEKRDTPVSWADTAVDAGKSLGSGVLRGAAGLADLPSDLAQLAVASGERLTGYKAPDEFKNTIDTNFREGMSDLTGGFSERKPETTIGRYAGTIGEFVPGAVAAALTGGGSMAANIARGAVAPAIASEAAGDLAEKAGYDPTFARVAGALAGGFGASKAEKALRGLVSPSGINPQNLEYANILKDQGVDVMAGQATKNARLMGIEGSTPRGQAILERQPAQVTRAAMKTIGSDAGIATPDTLMDAKNGILNRLAIADTIDVVPQAGASAKMAKTAADYFHGGVMPSIPPKISAMVNDIENAAASGVSIPGRDLRIWRTELGDLASSTDNVALQKTFRSAIDTIDDLQENAFRAAGRTDDLEKFLEGRGMYRNYLAIRDASLKSDSGILNPSHIRTALVSQGKSALAEGQRGSLGDLAMAAQNLLKPGAAQSRSAISKFVSTLIDGMGGGSGALLGNALSGTPGMVIGALVGSGIPMSYQVATGLARRLLASPIMQKALMSGAQSGFYGAAPKIMPSISGYTSIMDRAGRKTGGRVSNHEAAADQLVRAAERAKKGWSATTEPLLNQSDDAVAHALEVANRSI